ncbi:MAG: hypothetical protein KatS3mg068_1364 [Candidatus Sericytochromatia bacterium]|nr:MAG: hypothetical protein KatS3mg068_1364 [Candidatus Sericytochromatia bacterium]
MSLIGIFNRKGKSIDYANIKLMYNSIKDLPNYGYEEIINDNIGIALLKNKFISKLIYDANKNIIFVFEGSIYNKEELSNYINLKDLDNIQILLELYLKYKEDCLNKIVGDFYFLIFDINKNSLFLSRDTLGYTSLNYYFDDEIFVFSSNIKAILALKNIKTSINENKIISILSICYFNNYETMYKNINILPPNHYIKINTENFIVNKYWFPENIKINYKYKNTQEYSQELFYLLNKVIKSRINDKKNIGSMLSGGFDSSTISILTSNILKENNLRLKTYSHIPFYNVSNFKKLKHRLLDEKDNILDIVKFNENIDSKLLTSENKSLINSVIETLNIINMPIHGASNSYWVLDIFENTKNDNLDILLSGEFGNSSISLAGLDYLLPLKTLINIFGIRRAFLKKYLKRFVFYKLKTLKDIFFINRYIQDVSYLKSDFLKQRNFKNQLKESIYKRFSFYTNQEYCLNMISGFNTFRCYFGALLSEYYGVNYNDPTSDKRIIQYVLSIPNEFFFDDKGYHKNILRTMMKDLLPEKVLNNKNKGLQASDIGQRFLNEEKEIRYYISKFKKIDFINDMVNVENLENDLNYIVKNSKNYNYDNLKISKIVRTFMTLYFIMKNVA